MSVEDYNNGLIVGLSMKGLPYGVMQSWQPKSVTNANTSSITIDFDRYIPDPEVENYINALYFIYTYIEDQYTASILGWERVNLTTITFLLNDFFSCNGMITIVYNTQQGNLDALPSFVVNYVPTGVPTVIYRKGFISTPLPTWILSVLGTPTDHYYALSKLVPTEDDFTEALPPAFDAWSFAELGTGFDDSNYTITLEVV